MLSGAKSKHRNLFPHAGVRCFDKLSMTGEPHAPEIVSIARQRQSGGAHGQSNQKTVQIMLKRFALLGNSTENGNGFRHNPMLWKKRPRGTITIRRKVPRRGKDRQGRKGCRRQTPKRPAVYHLITPASQALGLRLLNYRSSKGNTAQFDCGISWKICALISSLFLEVHKVHLRKSAFIRTQIFSGSALAELCGIA